MEFDLAQVITAIGGIIGAFGGIYALWIKYNQEAKNKKTEYELEKLRNEDKKKNKKRSDNSMLVFGELWDIMHQTNASRVYIAQPHPLGHEEIMVIIFEVKRKGVESMKSYIQAINICDVPKFASELVKEPFMYITDIEKQISDEYARSIISSCGTKNVIIRRLSDNRHDWVGSIFCEYTNEMTITEEEVRKVLEKSAIAIQYILPEIEDDYDK
jgi:hypothetical protein